MVGALNNTQGYIYTDPVRCTRKILECIDNKTGHIYTNDVSTGFFSSRFCQIRNHRNNNQ